MGDVFGAASHGMPEAPLCRSRRRESLLIQAPRRCLRVLGNSGALVHLQSCSVDQDDRRLSVRLPALTEPMALARVSIVCISDELCIGMVEIFKGAFDREREMRQRCSFCRRRELCWQAGLVYLVAPSSRHAER